MEVERTRDKLGIKRVRSGDSKPKDKSYKEVQQEIQSQQRPKSRKRPPVHIDDYA